METQLALWRATLKRIESEMDRSQYEAWFSDLACRLFSSEEVRIEAPSAARKQYLQQHCRDVIDGAVKKACGWSPRITIFVKRGDRQNHTDPSSVDAFLLAAPDEQEDQAVPLNPDFTFENFVVGPCNQLAHAAALAVTESPGRVYNPFFVHSAVGMGKTHLLQAICHTVRRKDTSARILYLSCEGFVNQFIRAIQRGEVDLLRYRYKDVDILAVDDVHFLTSKERTQEEFFHTFNTLYHAQRQIILSSDSPPREIPALQERLVTRFNWGLVARLEIPEYETRVAIVKKKARLTGHKIPDDVVEYVAGTITSNIRELEGAVVSVLGVSALTNSPITIDLAKDALKENLPQKVRLLRLSDITEVVASHFGVTETDLQGKRRLKSIVLPRQVCMFLARKLTTLSLEEIGAHFGGRDHSTVLHSIEKVQNETGGDKSLSQTMRTIENTLTEE
jgi:chromosomal replication initiator protein